jgi:hypothetical protein
VCRKAGSDSSRCQCEGSMLMSICTGLW